MNVKIVSFFTGLLLFCATLCLAQSTVQTVTITPGSSVKLTATNSMGATSFQWFRDGNPIAGATLAIYTTSTPGSYTVISFNTNDCSSDLSQPIIVIINQVVSEADVSIIKKSDLAATLVNQIFEYHLAVKNNGPNEANKVVITDILPAGLSFEAIVKPQKGVALYQSSTRTITWEIPKLLVNETDKLTLRVKATQKGEIKNIARITAQETDPKLANNNSTDLKTILGIRIPNVFTPNNDGKNETFKIYGLDNYESNELVIINRWGSHVYEQKDYANTWTGDGLSNGTYYYVLRIKTSTSGWQELKGYITILR